MLSTGLASPVPSNPSRADCAMPPQAVSAMPRLALALLNLALPFEPEAGQRLYITPSLSVSGLAALAGLEDDSVLHWLDVLARSGVIGTRRQRLILWDRPALERLALA